MNVFRISLKNLQPICIRADRSDDRITTLDYIPGTTLLGALVNRYLAENEEDDTFHDFFTREKIIFPALYPVDAVPADSPRNAQLPGVFPLTARKCKRFGGFISSEEEAHGIYDRLFKIGVYSATRRMELLPSRDECPVCKGQMIPASGFYSLLYPGKTYRMCRIEKILQTHTGINRQTGTVSESILYNMETIEKSYSFEGRLVVIEESLVSPFTSWIKKERIHIGAKKTAGRGLSSVEMEKLPVLSISAFRQKLEQFDDAYKEYKNMQVKKQDEDDKKSFYFSIDLVSEAIRLDPFLNYISGFKGLCREEGLPDTELVFERTKPFEIMGWNNTLGLPRQIEIGIEKGSTALFKSDMPLEDVCEKLYRLEQSGIGIRKTEGFGQIVVSNDFHFNAIGGL